MDAETRKSLAQQILTNPLFDTLMDELSDAATERMIAAKDDKARLEAQAYALAVREFRGDCRRMLGNDRPKRQAPA